MKLKITQNKKDLGATLITQLWWLVSGPITMILIPLFLSAEQQGYWYLFGSLSALSIFADLGFSNIILQFSAHEYAFLHFNNKNQLEGDEDHLNKLGTFFKFTIKWISTISIGVFPIIYIVGIVFFIRDKVLLFYLLPWTIYSIGSLLNFFNGSIPYFISGLYCTYVNNIAYTAGRLSKMLCAQLGIRQNWIRILSVYGKNDRTFTLISYAINELKNGRSPELTKCEQIWDYLNCDDAANAFLAVAEKGVDGKVYPLGSGKGRRLSEYIEDIRNAINPKIELGFGKKEYYPHQPMYLVADISELRKDTGWKPKIEFKDAFMEQNNNYIINHH